MNISTHLSLVHQNGLKQIADGDYTLCSNKHMYEMLIAGLIEFQYPDWGLTRAGKEALAKIPYSVPLRLKATSQKSSQQLKWAEAEERWIQAKTMADVAQLLLDGQLSAYLEGRGGAPELLQQESLDDLRQCEERARVAMDDIIVANSTGEGTRSRTSRLSKAAYSFPLKKPLRSISEITLSPTKGPGKWR